MITDAVLGFLAQIAAAFLGVMPSVPVPGWLSSGTSAVATIFADLQSMGVWFPVDLILTVLAAYVAINMVGFGIKITRICASFLTGGGGSAA